MFHDDYLSCGAYESQTPHSKEKNFTAFYHEASQKYFFTMTDDMGKVLLVSEGYPEQKSRETGLQSVIKNRTIRERYTVINENGQYFLSLRAGNRREIARSCGFTTEGEALAILPYALGEKVAVAEAAKAPKAKVEKAPKAEKTEKVEKTEAKTKAPKVEKTVKAEKATAAPKAPKAKAAKPAQTTNEVYLEVENYMGHDNIWNEYGKTGYAIFSHDNGNHYFVVYNPDGSIYLRSEGFPTVESRDAVMADVVNNIENAEKYRIIESGDTFFVVLSGSEDNEIARSVGFITYSEAFLTTPRGREEVVAANLY